METVVLKIDHPKTSNKQSSLLTSIGEVIIRLLTFWIPRASPDYEANLKYVDYWYIEVDTNSGAPQREIGFDITNRAILFAPTDKNHGLWTDSPVQIDELVKIRETSFVDKEIFNDIFESLEKYDFKIVESKINKYLTLWTRNPNIKTPELPILIFDERMTDIIVCNSIQQVYDSDITGYEWESQNCIDKTGAVYLTSYINFGHPVGCVIPKEIVQVMDIAELKTKAADRFPKFRQEILNSNKFEDLFELLTKTG